MPDELFLFGEDVSQVATPPIIARSSIGPTLRLSPHNAHQIDTEMLLASLLQGCSLPLSHSHTHRVHITSIERLSQYITLTYD
jgi:hypothetical protein